MDRRYFLTTDRLAFGRWGPADFDLANAIWGDPDVVKLNGGPFTKAQVEARLAAEIANQEAHGFQYWPVFRRDTDENIGCCGLRPRCAEDGVFELGYQFRPSAWGKGYASEAGRAVIAWAAGNAVTALFAGHHPDNHASKRVLMRLGFTYTHDEFYAPTGLMEPCYILAIG